jgi:hypothetical protein
VAAEEMGLDGAYFRVHHFAAQLASPFPLLSATGARTNKIDIGTGVIDIRYENPLYMVEDEAIKEADTLLLTIPNTLGVEYNVHVLSSILKHVAPALGWR